MNDKGASRSDTGSIGLWEKVVNERLDVLEHLSSRQIEPWPPWFDRTHSTQEIRDLHGALGPDVRTGNNVAVAGRIRLIRNFGRLLFITFFDQTGDLQLFISRDTLAAESKEVISRLDLGDWVGATGEVITTRRGELSVQVDRVTLLAKCLAPLPDKWKGLRDVEQRSRHRHLDLLVNPESRRTFEIRSAVVSELRNQFHQRGFMEVDTPILTSRAAGAAARPFRTHHNALDIELYMRIATELYLKRLIIGGFERVFEIGRIFRNEGVDSSHNPEFTMLESYQSFADYRDVMELLEEVIPAVATAATGTTMVSRETGAHSASPLSPRTSLPESFDAGTGERGDGRGGHPRHGSQHPEEAGGKPGSRKPGTNGGAGRVIYELFDRLTAPRLWEPTFVLDYPPGGLPSGSSPPPETLG